jgi:membrane protein DedA with SNARE-associated domain
MAARQIVKREKTRIRRRMLFAILGLFVWTVVSFAFIEIALEGFDNEENYLKLAGWIAAILAGYAVLLYMLGVRRKKKEEEAEQS